MSGHNQLSIPQRRATESTRLIVQASPNGFPFKKLPLFIRNMIYKLTISYDSIHDVARKLNALERWEDLDPYDMRLRNTHYLETRFLWKRRYEMHTPSMLLLSNEIYAEAVEVLREQPFSISGELRKALSYRRLLIVDFVPLHTLQHVTHLHYGTVQKDFHPIDVLWEGIRAIEFGEKGYGKKNKLRGALVGGRWALKRMSFDRFGDGCVMIDLKDVNIKQALAEFRVLIDDMPRDKQDFHFRSFIEEHGKQCTSHTVHIEAGSAAHFTPPIYEAQDEFALLRERRNTWVTNPVDEYENEDVDDDENVSGGSEDEVMYAHKEYVSETEGENEYTDEYEDGWLVQTDELENIYFEASGSDGETEEEDEEDEADFTDGVPSSDTEPLTDHDSDPESERHGAWEAEYSREEDVVKSEAERHGRIKEEDAIGSDDVISISSDN